MKILKFVVASVIAAAAFTVAPVIIAPAHADGAAPAAAKKLTGKIIGTQGSYQNGGNDLTKAFDGDVNTFFDAPESSNGNGVWVGLDLGKATSIAKIRFYPRTEFPDRMIGGKFQGSTTADFAKPVDLFIIKDSPKINAFTEVTTLLTKTPFQYVRYLSPDDGWGNVNEIEFY